MNTVVRDQSRMPRAVSWRNTRGSRGMTRRARRRDRVVDRRSAGGGNVPLAGPSRPRLGLGRLQPPFTTSTSGSREIGGFPGNVTVTVYLYF